MGDNVIVVNTYFKNATKAEKGIRRTPEMRMEEILGLVNALDVKPLISKTIVINEPRSATLISRGAVEEIKETISSNEINVAVVNAHLSPVQLRNLKKNWGCEVVDRVGLILKIFGVRARTKEGILQVRLAERVYQKSHLVRAWSHFTRQGGHMGGEGEAQIELDRRKLSDEIIRLKKEIVEVEKTRKLHRKGRKEIPFPIVALVGYTNSGKSTLFNRLTSSEVFAKDLLFATLDPTLRSLKLPSKQEVILSDTVGFISDLPHQLVSAFKATLEEVVEADLILLVSDVSHAEHSFQENDVLKVLSELGLDEDYLQDKMIRVYNKSDLLNDEDKLYWQNYCSEHEDSVLISAFSMEGIDDLLQSVVNFFDKTKGEMSLTVPYENGKLIAWLHSNTNILETIENDETVTYRFLISNNKIEKLFKLQHVV